MVQDEGQFISFGFYVGMVESRDEKTFRLKKPDSIFWPGALGLKNKQQLGACDRDGSR